MSLEIFIVFHKEIHEDNYKDLTEDEKRHLTFVAVNEAIPKVYDSSKYRVIKEWELPIYHPELQQNGFNENSVIRHLYENKIAMSDYVGITQYDFHFPKNSIQAVVDKIRSSPTRVFFGSELKHYEICFVYTWLHFDTYNARIVFELMKQKYEQLRNRPINRNKEFPLLNSYIIPTKTFYEIMPHVNDLYKLYMEHQVFGSSAPFKDLAGSFERVMAFMVGQEADILNHWNITHTH